MILEEYKKLHDSTNVSLFEFLLELEIKGKFASSQEKDMFLKLLLNDLANKNWDEKLKTKGLSVIRTLGRDPVGSDSLFSKEGIIALTKFAGLCKPEMATDTPSSREALKCIANCIFLNEAVKAILEQENIVNACQYRLKYSDYLHIDTQFSLCRILLFLTTNRPDLVGQLVQSDISKSIEKVLETNVGLLQDQQSRQQINLHTPINPYTVTTEALKLLFSLMLVESRKDSNNDSTSECFKACLPPIFKILFQVTYFEPQPIVPPHAQAIHALMQFNYDTIAKEWASQEAWTSKLYKESEGYTFIATTLVDILDRAIRVLIPSEDPDSDSVTQADSTLAPLLLVLVNLAEGEPNIKQTLAELMLPGEKDRLLPVNEGQSLSAYLIRIMTSTMMPQTRDAVSETLFVLCNKDAAEFTEKIGYGNAAGFLVNKRIPFDQPTSNTRNKKDINPITGQYIPKDKVPDLKDMTDEEKEREAEKVFVLFERLKKTGIIDVENPIAKAMRESQGRFEQVDEDSDDD